MAIVTLDSTPSMEAQFGEQAMSDPDSNAPDIAARGGKHTPTPWEAWQSPDGLWTARSVYRDEQNRRCTAWPATFACGAQDNKANAEFAVKAVNTHENLVAFYMEFRETARAVAAIDSPFSWLLDALDAALKAREA